MNDDDIQSKLLRAAKLASVVPDSMQGAALSWALGMLAPAVRGDVDTDQKQDRDTARSKSKGADDGSSDAMELLLAMRRDRAVAVDAEERAIGKGMALLRVAYDELQLDGLTALQVASLLTNKFRWRVSRQAIQQAFDAAGPMVDRRTGRGRATTYHLMKLGEEWLDTPVDQRASPAAARRRKKRVIN